MNLLLASNQISERTDNRTNDFEIDIQPPTDARYGNFFIRVNELMYPQTISTIYMRNREDFTCLFSLKISNFMLKADGSTYVDGVVGFMHEKVTFPDGNYTVDNLLGPLNRKFNFFGVYFEVSLGNCCMLKFKKELVFYSGSAVLSTGKTIDGYDSN